MLLRAFVDCDYSPFGDFLSTLHKNENKVEILNLLDTLPVPVEDFFYMQKLLNYIDVDITYLCSDNYPKLDVDQLSYIFEEKFTDWKTRDIGAIQQDYILMSKLIPWYSKSLKENLLYYRKPTTIPEEFILDEPQRAKMTLTISENNIYLPEQYFTINSMIALVIENKEFEVCSQLLQLISKLHSVFGNLRDEELKREFISSVESVLFEIRDIVLLDNWCRLVYPVKKKMFEKFVAVMNGKFPELCKELCILDFSTDSDVRELRSSRNLSHDEPLLSNDLSNYFIEYEKKKIQLCNIFILLRVYYEEYRIVIKLFVKGNLLGWTMFQNTLNMIGRLKLLTIQVNTLESTMRKKALRS